MKKFRIGNDIKLRVSLLKKSNQNDLLNIQRVKAYLVNTTAIDTFKAKINHKIKFLSRYPIEPMCNAYKPTFYNLNNSGYPTYIVHPHHCKHFIYGGFGVHPDWCEHYCPKPIAPMFEYRAKVRATSNRGIVDVYFPAEKQLWPGIYKLIIVADIYQDAFCDNSLRTITMDYECVFELVTSTQDGEGNVVTDDDVIVELDDDQNVNPDTGSDDTDIFVTSGSFDDSNKDLVLNRSNIGSVTIETWGHPDEQ